MCETEGESGERTIAGRRLIILNNCVASVIVPRIQMYVRVYACIRVRVFMCTHECACAFAYVHACVRDTRIKKTVVALVVQLHP